MKRGGVIIYCLLGDCRRWLFVITSFHCFSADLHFTMAHFTKAIQSSMNVSAPPDVAVLVNR